MSAAIWASWGEEWLLDEPVNFNGSLRHITVNTGVTSITVQEIYSAWKRWAKRESQFVSAMRYSGYDPIPGGYTGATYFMINEWKLCYDPNVVAISGVLYSEDFSTAFWSLDGFDPLYPATVSALVNSAVSYQNVVTGIALTQEETASAVWNAAARTLTASLDPNASQIAAAVLAEILANVIPANIKKVNDVTVGGTGQLGSEWGPT